MKNSNVLYWIGIMVILPIFTGCNKLFVSHDDYKYNVSSKTTDIYYNIEEVTYAKVSDNYDKEYNGIVAFVNGDIITATKLKERVDLALFSIGGNINEKQKSNLYTEILNEMIEEKLKMQCIRKYVPKGDLVSGKEINIAFQNLAERNNMTEQAFSDLLKANKLKKEAILEQIAVNLSWVEYIRARFGKNVVISEAELKRTIADIKQKMDDESFWVCRMFFPFSSASEEQNVLAHVNNLYHMLLHGADFASIARQFSKGAGAERGGDLSWIFEGQLPAQEIQAIRNMSVGAYKIVRNNNGYSILYLKDKKGAGLRTYTSVNFIQVVMPFSENGKPCADSLKQLIDYLMGLKKSAKNCHDFIAKAKESGVLGVSDSMSGVIEAMQPKFRIIAEKIPVGGISEPIVMDEGIFMICMLDKKLNTIKIPTENEIKTQKMDEQLTLLARAELNFLKRKSFVKIDNKYISTSDR